MLDLGVMTVSELNGYVKEAIEVFPPFQNVYVSGEISNFTNHYRSGHYYMSLKDEKSVLKAVMFRGQNQRLRFTPENGMKVLVRARLGVYERDGIYQLYIEDMQPQGVGALGMQFQQVKARLEAEGLLEETRKRQVPEYPERVGIITSETGAAIQDMLDILGRRYPAAEIVFCPAQVQGEGAAKQLTEAVQRMNRAKAADVLIIGRGGGSAEDLWAFNDETLARTVAGSKIPVISAVGHETDVTICDFAADLRAPTPSAAAELCVPDQKDLKEQLRARQMELRRLIERKAALERTRLKLLQNAPVMQNVKFLIQERQIELDGLEAAMRTAMTQKIQRNRMRFSEAVAKLDSLSPLNVLARGYAAVKQDGKLVVSVKQAATGQPIQVQMQDGFLACTIDEISETEESA